MQNSSLVFSRKLLLAGSAITLSLTLAACSPAPKSATTGTTTTATAQVSPVTFTQEAKLNEEVPVTFKLTKEGKDTTATVSLRVKEFTELPELDNTKPIAGQTFYVASYDVHGSLGVKPTDKPSYLYDPAGPQLVLLSNTSTAATGGSIPGAFSSAAAKHYKVTDPNTITWATTGFTPTAAAWYTTKTDKPTLAIQYTDAAGKKQFVKINY